MIKFNMTRLFGAHVSASGGLKNVIVNAYKLHITATQIHPSAPQRWITKDIDHANIEELIKAHKKTQELKVIFAHAIYLINLANPDKQKFHLSKMAVVSYLNFMHYVNTVAPKFNDTLKVGGVVVHPGSAKHVKTAKQAIQQVQKGLNWILENSSGGTILLETTAGSGQIIGDTFEELAQLRQNSIDKTRVQFCLDTQHMWASGYDLKNNLDKIVENLDKTLGIENIKLIHLNDSATELGSHKDRHANLGEGTIGLKTLANFINHPELKHIPVVLETPGLKELKTAKLEVEKLKKILN